MRLNLFSINQCICYPSFSLFGRQDLRINKITPSSTHLTTFKAESKIFLCTLISPLKPSLHNQSSKNIGILCKRKGWLGLRDPLGTRRNKFVFQIFEYLLVFRSITPEGWNIKKYLEKKTHTFTYAILCVPSSGL